MARCLWQRVINASNDSKGRKEDSQDCFVLIAFHQQGRNVLLSWSLNE